MLRKRPKGMETAVLITDFHDFLVNGTLVRTT